MAGLLMHLFVALTLGLAWALRGHFGHEWGASWAGSLAAAALLVAARRPDWNARLPVLVSLSALGWGAGGMMSYGLIVGYGRADDFPNAFYGLTMLAVVGGLYGYLGGGLFGLGLESDRQKSPRWSALITEMVAGAILAWSLLIYQLEWKMTPPRSELWAACFGASIALTWYLARNGYWRAIRVAGFAAAGAGFGFAFGNFLQILGNLSGISANWWNLMEFTLGFFGGLGMTFGVYRVEWPESRPPSRTANWLSLAFLAFAIPATNVIQAMHWDEFFEAAGPIPIDQAASLAAGHLIASWVIVLSFFALCLAAWYALAERKNSGPASFARVYLCLSLATFLALSHIKKGIFLRGLAGQPEQWLYWVAAGLILLIGVCLRVLPPPRTSAPCLENRLRLWIQMAILIVVACALMAWISVHLHDGLGGAQRRFG